MSDSNFPPRPGDDAPRLPTSRRESEDSPDDAPEQISLEEMMARLQRSGSSEGRSGRRRRSSSSPSSSSPGERSSSRDSREETGSRRRSGSERSSSRSSSGSRSSREKGSESADDPGYHASTLPRAVLPPPRRQDLDAAAVASSKRPDGWVNPAIRRRRWFWGIVVVLAVGVLLWLGIRMLNRWRIEGEGFRVNAGRRISELTGRKVSFARFLQVGSDRLASPAVQLSPNRPDLLESATFTEANAEFATGSWLADDWTIRNLRFKKIELAFRPTKPFEEADLYSEHAVPVDRGATDTTQFRLSMTAEPGTVQVDAGRFDELNLSWPGPAGQLETLQGMQGNFRNLQDVIQMEMAGGILDTSSWPAMAVKQLNARLRGTSLEIVSARLGLIPNHEVRLSGTANLVPNGKLSLKADIAPILTQHFLPEPWSTHVLGTFDSSGAVWQSHFQSGPPPLLSGSFRIKGFVLRSLPFVEKIAALFTRPELTLLEFPSVTGEYAWTPGMVRINNFTGTTSDGLFRMSGKVSLTPGDNFSADLRIEANDAYFVGIPAASAALFSPAEEEGWRTMTFSLRGKESAFTDNIAIVNPAYIQKRASTPDATPAPLDPPRMSLPPGVAVPASPSSNLPPPSAAPPSRSPALPPAANPAIPPRQTPKPSDAELEKSFKELLRG